MAKKKGHIPSEGVIDSLKVEYHCEDGGTNLLFEECLKDLMDRWNLKRWASGMEMGTHIRDIAYEKAK